MVSQIDATLPVETTGPNAGKILVSRLRTALAVAKVEITALQEAGAAVDNSEAVTALQTSVADIETAVDAVELKLSSDNTDLDTMQELVDAIEALQVAIASAGGNAATQTIQDLGDVSGTVNLDLQAYDAYRFNATANVTINLVNPPAAGVHKPVTVYATRTSATNAIISFGTSISWVGSQVVPSLRDNQTTVFSVSTTNVGTSYLGFSNGIVFEITASGDAATWNPNDKDSRIALSSDGLTADTVDHGDSVGHAGIIRMFGAKNSGKWQFCCRNLREVVSTNGGERELQLGIAQLAHPLNVNLGVSIGGIGFRAADSSEGSSAIRFHKHIDSVDFIDGFPSFNLAANALYNILVHFDDVAGLIKVWMLVDGVPVSGGDPNAGTGADAEVPIGDFWFPAAGLASDSSTMHPGLTVLNEIENPYLDDFPSFVHWTI